MILNTSPQNSPQTPTYTDIEASRVSGPRSRSIANIIRDMIIHFFMRSAHFETADHQAQTHPEEATTC